MIDAEAIAARMRKTESETDDRGRMIELGMLRMSQVARLNEFTESATNQMIFQVVCSVRRIGESVYAMPESRAKVDAVLDALGPEGFSAAARAFRRLNGIEEPTSDGETTAGEDGA